MTFVEYEGLAKLLKIAGADVSYSLLGQPDEVIFTIPQLITFIDILIEITTKNAEKFAQLKEDDVQ